jgi:4-amino-4-deoxy-L-arabinose transferase-like glycosyltransferase
VRAIEAPREGGRAARLRRFAALVLAAALVSFAGVASHALWTPDEPRDAAIGKAMWRSGDLVVPRLNGRPFLEKPPLAWWAQVASYRLLGASDATARLPSAVFGTLTLLVAAALGRRLGGRRAGWLAAGVLASTIEWAEDMHRAIVDPPLVLTVALSYLGFVLLLGESGAPLPPAFQAPADPPLLPLPTAQVPGDAPPSRAAGPSRLPRPLPSGPWRLRLLIGLIAIAAGLAFLAKGLVGLALALAPPLAYLLGAAALADWRARRAPGPAAPHLNATLRSLAPLAFAGVPIVLALALPWTLALLHEGGWPMVRECLINNTVGRLFATDAGRVYGHREPLWYYLPAGAFALLPWSLALPAVLRSHARGAGARRGATAREAAASAGDATAQAAAGGTTAPGFAAASARRLLLASFFLGTALLTIAASKRTVYLVPLLPALAVPTALWLDRIGSGSAPRETAERLPGPLTEPAGPGWDRATALLLLAVATLLPILFWTVAALAAHGALSSFPAAPLRLTLTTGRLAAAAALALAASALLLGRFVGHLRRHSTPSAPWLVVPYLALSLVYQTAVKAAIDPLKNPHDLTAAVARLDPGRGPVAAYRPSETTEGIEGFDLDRAVEPFDTPAALVSLLARRPQARVVLSLADLRRLPPDLRARLCLLYDESSTKASPFAIATSCAAATTPPAR